MPDIVNPYVPGQPVGNPNLFFGRRELLASIQEHLLRGRRLFVVSGARRMGKSSVLRQLSAQVSDDFLPVRVDLAEEGGQRLDWLLWRLAEAIGHELERRLGVQDMAPDWSEFEGRTSRLLDHFWPRVRTHLAGHRLLLMLDDLDCLAQGENGLLASLVTILGMWRDRDEDSVVVVATSVALQEILVREHARLFGGALTYELSPLSSEEATRLITWPVDGVLTYDYGVARRLIEITSGHPYYLQLLCFEVFHRCAPAGWVNQRDVDLVLEELVGREIADFRQVWDASLPPEQAVLAALVSLRGARGVATAQEVRTALVRAGARPGREPVDRALDALVNRGILEQLGALSYRFRVALLRDWLAERLDLAEIARDVRWISSVPKEGMAPRVRKLRPRRERAERRPAPPPPQSVVGEQARAEEAGPVADWHFPRLWVLAVAALILILVAAVGSRLLPPPEDAPAALAATSTAVGGHRPTATLVLAFTPRPTSATTVSSPTAGAVPTRRPSPSATPLPTPTPSPTPPLIVARSLPAIVYQALAPGESNWSIFAMNSDGGNRIRLTDGQFDAFSPVWSPDGTRIAFGSDRSGYLDIWTMDSEGGELVNLTQSEAQDRWPAWSPDGDWIAFASVRDAVYWEIYVVRTDGSELQRVTWWEDASDWSPSWSPDGTRLAFASKRDGNWEIYTVDRDGANLLRLTQDPADDTNPAWSPDGSRIAFESTRDGYTDIFVMPAIGGEALNLTNLAWATALGPTWSPDGGRIAFYSDQDGEWDIYVMASDGSDMVKLTGDGSNDQVPSWRP